MKCKRFAKNATVWSLIAALSNPALMVPAVYGRDTDIFLGITTSLSTAEPNILIVLDTSDSMNTYEGWREYDLRDALGAPKYDSHIEYLWNDPTYINTITAVTPDANFSNVGSSPDNYFVDYSGSCPNAANATCPRDSGFFAGTTDALRATLKTQVLAHAAAAEPGDPGARSIYRNYNDASWLYWLPTGTAESNNRLWSFSFNRFIGGIRVSNFSSTNGASNPVVRGGFAYGINRDFTVGSALRTSAGAFNRCTASMADMMPSTVYAPSELPRNTGKAINQQWQRWERWLNLENSRAAVYPGSHALTSSTATPISSGNYRVGMVGTGYNDSAAASTTFPGPSDPRVDPPATALHGVGSTTPPFTAFRDDTGVNGSSGLPIRVQLDIAPNGVSHASDSHAGWADLKADLGGFLFHGVQTAAGIVDQSVTVLPQARLTELRGIYGYALLSAAGATALENERFSAWKGNRDVAATPFGMVTGTHAYYDIRPTVNVGGVLRDVINNVSGVTPGNTCTRACGVLAVGADGPNAAGFDGSNNNRTFYRDGTGGLYCQPDGGALSGTCAPTAGGAAVPTCTPTADTGFVTRNQTGCAWTGRSSKFIEGVGTVFYGGTCSGSCRGAGFVLGAPGCPSGPTSTNYCAPANSATEGANWIGNFTVDGTAYTNVTKNAIGNCSDIADTAQNCSTHRPGDAPCLYGPSTVAAFCPPRSNTTAPTGGTTMRFPGYSSNNAARRELAVVHDCKADEPANNGGANVFMTIQKRNFDQAFNTTISTAGTVAAYTTNAGDAITPPAIDLYSVNYLNWKYGAKSASSVPIGRKTRLQIAKDALNDLIAVTDGVRFGLETFNALPNDFPLRGSQGSQGGKIVFPVKRMGSNAADPDFANRQALRNVINNELARAATPLTESLYEAYLYFSGRAPRFGTSGAITANFGATALPAVGSGNVTDGADATAISAGTYVSPMLNNPTLAAPSSCQKNFVILITDGGPEKDLGAGSQIQPLRHTNPAGDIYSPDTNVDTTEANTASGQFETGTPSLPYGPKDLVDNTSYVWLDELAYFMSRADMSPGAPHLASETTTDSLVGTQIVVTYTIGFAGAASPVLENAAAKAGGAYYIAEDSGELAAALTDALIKIRDWDPTVAAPTVPLSALNRSQNALDIYLAFFAPATSQTWKGTVKRFRIGIGTADCGPSKDLCLIGKTVLSSGVKDIEKLEFDAATGFSQVIVDAQAVSFWNPVTLADGSEPDQGGTGYQIISVGGYTPATRNVYTFISSGATSAALTDPTNLVSEANSRISKAVLGNAAMSDATQSTLINYIRGGNTGDSACSDPAASGTPCNTWRSWAHNDVQHSRPVIVTYNSTPTPDAEAPGSDRATVQYLFYLTNDGLVHAVDASNGREKWVFLIEEALPKISAVMANAGGPSHDLADGTPVAWVDRGDADGLVDGSERVWLFFGLRRGGRAYYALDITNIDAPQFKWRITPTERCVAAACAATADFAQLGQSWSTPVVGRVSAVTGVSGSRPAGNADPVVMFGGGYDPQQDTQPLPAGTTSDTMGKAVFIVEGSNAALVKSFTNAASDFVTAASIDWSIPSDLTVVDINLDAQGLLDRIVVGDVGGNVWRFDISALDATAWKGKKLAALSDPGVPNRKILFPPVIALQKDPFPVPWHAVYVGTGDREHPLVTTSSDKIFMIVDFDTSLTATAGPPASFSGGDFLSLTLADTGGVVPATLVTKRGWVRDLEAGEKVTGPPFVINQKLRFGSYNPSAVISACLPPGEGRLNEISALYGDLMDLSGDGVISGRDRYYAGVSRGFFSPLQTVIIGGSVFTISIAGGSVTSTTSATPPPPGSTGVCGTGSMFWTCREQRVGVAQRVYWYMEPEQ